MYFLIHVEEGLFPTPHLRFSLSLSPTCWFLCLTYDLQNLPLVLNYEGLELVVIQFVAKYDHETFILQEKMKLCITITKLMKLWTRRSFQKLLIQSYKLEATWWQPFLQKNLIALELICSNWKKKKTCKNQKSCSRSCREKGNEKKAMWWRDATCNASDHNRK